MAQRHWTSLFFDEANIVHTFQLLLMRGNKTLDELFQLCLVMHESPMILAFTVEGLTPFAMHSEYVIPYEKMNREQIRALRLECMDSVHDVMSIDYGTDIFVVKIDVAGYEVDDALMLFAAACIILNGLSTQTLTRGGYVTYVNVRLDPDLTVYHLNNAIFKIVHSCLLRPGVERQAMHLLNKYTLIA